MDNEWAWLTISRQVKAKLYILDTACEANELEEFQRRYHLGKAVSGHVLSVNKEKKLLRLVPQPLNEGKLEKRADGDLSTGSIATHIHEGCVVGGRISKILPGVCGLVVQIGPHTHGRVHFTELKDLWVSDPLSGYQEGQFIKCKVLEVSRSVKGTIQFDLSLRLSSDGMPSENSSKLCTDV